MASRTFGLAESMYELALAKDGTESDINRDLPLLRLFAEECGHITEFGVRNGVSTCALLAAQPNTLVSYDLRLCASIPLFRQARGQTHYAFVIGDTLEADIDVTDMLFIDTFHTYAQLAAELVRHHEKVKKYIVMHDTVSFGTKGEDDSVPGLGAAIDDFVATNPWRVVLHSFLQNGLTVLERIGEWTAPKIPSDASTDPSPTPA